MSSSPLTLGIIILVVVIYMVVRQFQERPVQFPGIFILPGILTYYTYTNVSIEFTRHVVDPTWLVAALIIGLLPGLALGFFRGTLAHIRLDSAAGKVYARASTLSLVLWCILLVVKIGAAILTYSPSGATLLPLVLLITVLHTLFLGNIIGEKYCLYQRSTLYRQDIEHPMPIQKVKW